MVHLLGVLVVVVVMVVVAFPRMRGLFGKVLQIILRLRVYEVEVSSQATVSLFRPRVSPHWLGELRRL